MRHSIAGHLRGRSESIKSKYYEEGEVDKWLTKLKGRSSTEEQRDAAEDDTTVVEPDQNNGTETLNLFQHFLTVQCSPISFLSYDQVPTCHV